MVSRRVGAVVLVSLLGGSLWTPRVGAGSLLPVDAVGRLVLNGRYVCAAFPIRSEQLPTPPGSESATYRNWLVTAGHCLEQIMFRGQPAFLVNTRGGDVAYPAAAYPTVPAGFSAGRPWGFDVAVLVFWTPRPLPVLEPAFNHQPADGDWLVAAGYPRGVLSFIGGRYLGRNEDQQLLVDAPMSRGSSGGPVLIPGTRKVVGVVVEATVSQSEEAPYACMFKVCAVDRPYKAASIDWVLPLVRW